MRNKSNECKYYVYVWYVIEPHEIFYVGKGSGKRAKDLRGRNKFFMNMYSTHICDYHIIMGGMLEDDAFKLERALIAHIREAYPKFRLANICDGGEGVSGWIADEQYREHMRQRNTGENNPNYHNWWPEERKAALSKKLKETGNRKGSNNAHAKPIMCVETGEIFDYIGAALAAYDIKEHSNMSAALKSPRRTAGGKHWVIGDMIQELSTVEARDEYLQKYKRRPSSAT